MLSCEARILDIGSRKEKILPNAISMDIDFGVKPDVCASAQFLPFRSECFDYICMFEVIEHLDNKQLEGALTEGKRVARLMVVSTPNCDSKIWSWIIWPVWSHTVGREWIGAHKQFFGKHSVEDLLEKDFGMKIIVKNYSRWNLLLLINANPALKILRKSEVPVQQNWLSA
jgi:2-polyprenyl-3-methyl-5-hydroxy-6-metoxy-1,4-benzoquinol methylase